MAYRGRVLLEVTTKLVDKPEQRIEDIPSDDLLVVEVRGKEGGRLQTQRKVSSAPSLFLNLFLRLTEVSQEEEVLSLRGVLLGHAPPGRRRRHPVRGQHR